MNLHSYAVAEYRKASRLLITQNLAIIRVFLPNGNMTRKLFVAAQQTKSEIGTRNNGTKHSLILNAIPVAINLTLLTFFRDSRTYVCPVFGRWQLILQSSRARLCLRRVDTE